MKRKIFFTIVTAICIIALVACTTTTPTAVTAGSNDTNETVLTQPVSGETSAPAPTAASNTDSTSTLACENGNTSASLTPELTEGPYFTANSPERASLFEDGMTGTKIVVTGYVYTSDCQPVANALLDFWQADANGVYDNSGYTLRGHQFTDENGYYELTTVVPGIYPGRTEHIHLKVQAPNGQLITSQLFFPGVTQNDSDGIYVESLLLAIQETSDGLLGQYNFVVPAQ